MISHLIFDLDGTLVDSIADIYEAHLKTMTHYKLTQPLDYEKMKSFIGPGIQFLSDYIVSGSCISSQEYKVTFRHYYQQQIAHHTRLYAGMLNVLTRLFSRVSMSVLTNKIEDSAKLLLHHLNVDHFFKKIAGPDTYQGYKPDPVGIQGLNQDLGFNPSQTLMIGDSQNDIQAAKVAGVFSMGVTWGYEKNIQNFSPDYIVHSADELLDTVLKVVK